MSRDERARARELLAAEYERDGHIDFASEVRAGNINRTGMGTALRAVTEALRGASDGGEERTEAALHSAMVKASTNVELLDAPTPPDDKMLLRCPFCHGAMQFRKALWPSDGDSDAIIHAVLGGSNCPMGDFGNGTADESIISLWNTRTPDHPAENAKSSGEVRAASVAELLEMLSVANQEDGSAIFDHTPDEIGLHVMENHKEILAALARSGKGEG
ncbi:hypothetical protein GG804_25955 [Sphingomonas histidinilytica]|uniref:hypothetical protein n=1 Tax=Rhizorhabdus histidinilytica TaxID=439228 RepID=UPI001ADD049D|nr:hypothetical protein [Rhizorhabdus histidinilytica]MBO9380215.1 hypothetical protein [Rhizorhabdus histidinilytica]